MLVGMCVGEVEGSGVGAELELGYIDPLRDGDDDSDGSIEGLMEGC